MFKKTTNFEQHAFRAIVTDNASDIQHRLERLSHSLDATCLFLGVVEKPDVFSLIALRDHCITENFTYPLRGTPCEQVHSSGTCVYPQGVLNAFPNDAVLQDFSLDGYIGIPIKNETNESIGLLVALFPDVRTSTELKRELCVTFAEQISTLIQKCHLDNQVNAQLGLLNEVQAIAQTGVWESYPKNRQVFWSDEVYRIHGLPIGSTITAHKAINYYADHEQDRISEAFESLVERGEPYDLELAFIDASGRHKWVRTTGKAEADNNGEVVRCFGAIEDITALKTLAVESLERADKIENILDNINDAVVTIDRNGVIGHCNQVAVRMFGYPEEELINADIAMLMPEPYASRHSEYMTHYERTGEAKIIGVGRQLPARRKNGEVFQMELSLSESHEGGEKQYIGVVRDISERIEAQDAIYNLAFTDNVTNLRNSQWFEREAKELMVAAMRQHHCIHALLLDMDKMASFNRRFGFTQGDNALKVIADKLKRTIGNDYAIYKYDADAFIILSKKTHTAASLYKFNASLIESALLHPETYHVTLDEGSADLSASLGSAFFDPGEQSFETVLSVLEHAVKRAKKDAPFGLCHIGREGVEEYDRYIAIHNQLNLIASGGELSLALQPQYDENANIGSFEALIRWHSDSLGWVSPAEFIPLAEENGQILQIGEWVIKEACGAIKEMLALGIEWSVAINISARQIVDPGFFSFLIRTLKHEGVSPQSLMLELTETALVSDMSVVNKHMSELATYGFRFSVDDFGTGYSSLAYLKELPIAELKIDKYFVDDIQSDAPEAEYVIVDAIINMCRALGVACVAEGVETEQQRNYLARKGCDLYQGYYYSKPLTIESWRELIKAESNNT